VFDKRFDEGNFINKRRKSSFICSKETFPRRTGQIYENVFVNRK